MNYRFMRTLLFFDLPSVTSAEKRYYRQFVKLIKKNGFVMLQESVYSMLSLNQERVDSKINLIKKEVPPKGNVMALTITEKQFASIQLLLGDIKTDVITSDERTLIF